MDSANLQSLEVILDLSDITKFSEFLTSSQKAEAAGTISRSTLLGEREIA